MKSKSLLDRALFYISVPTCVNCKEKLSYNDKSLCKSCYAKYLEAKTRSCSLCAKQLSECSCSTDYLIAHSIRKLIKVFRYRQGEGSDCANSLIYSLKTDNRRDVIDLCADELVSAIRASVDSPHTYLITNVPRRRNEIIRHGFDQSAKLASAVSKRLGAQYRSLLISRSKRPQKETHGEERLHNASFDIKRGAAIENERVIIVDDVTTTGASLGTASVLLRALGAKKIIGATLAITQRDGAGK